ALDGVTQSDPEGTLSRWFGTAASEARAACGSWLRDVDPASYKAAYSVFAASDGPTPAQLENLNCAALFATGGDEPNSTPRMSQAMASLTPKGRAVVVPDAAHMMPMTDAAFVNQTLRTFVEECFA
ncbi:MAG: alpha/beta hydrolase, partial [Rhodobacteraceae bacterium]|nr:alpha/beta hydrolase [Paracoccaceae bacterium]